MDDQTFDQKTAREWIDTIESENARIRETDIYPRIRDWVARTSPAQVLEIGSGQGACSQAIGTDLKYFGVDPSLFLLERAKDLYGNESRKFLEGSVYQLPFPAGGCDAVFSVAVWHLLADLERATTELNRVLKRGGHFLVITANPEEYSTWTSRYTEGRREGTRFGGTTRHPDGSESRDVLHLHPYEALLNSFLVSGLTVEKTDNFRGNILIEGRK